MAAKKIQVDARTEVSLNGVVVNPAIPEVVIPEVPKGGPLSFAMFAAMKGIPQKHHAGMRAFTDVQQATLTEWNAIFAAY